MNGAGQCQDAGARLTGEQGGANFRAMNPVVFVAVLIVAVASRPIEVRLWRAGRLSDRTAALLIVSRFPIVTALYGVASGAPLALAVGITMGSCIFPVLMYRTVLDNIREAEAIAKPPR
jgi:hypothetical protein